MVREAGWDEIGGAGLREGGGAYLAAGEAADWDDHAGTIRLW